MVRFQPSLAITRVQRSSLRPAGAVPPAGTVSLAMGEPDFPTPEPIVDAGRRALADGYTHYGDLNGDFDLREVIAATASRASGQAYSEDNVAVTHGGAAAINAAVLASVNPEDRVLIPEPTYSLYPDAVRLAGGEPVLIPTTSGHRLDMEALADALHGARMIMLCNPVNPTGTVFTEQELRTLGELVAGTDTLILADEAYAEIVYDGVPFTSALAIDCLRERLIYCQTLSKTYAMTGWRVGYVIAPAEMTVPIRHVHRTFNSALNAVVQRAAATALRLGPELAAPMLRTYQQRRDLVVKRLTEMDEVEATNPEGAFYAFAKYRRTLPSEQVVQRLLAGGVAVRAGSEYGPSGEGHIRLSFAADFDTLNEGLNRIQETLARL